MAPPGPPPPPPPAPARAVTPPEGGAGRGALLASIQKGAKLKKAETNDRSAPITASKPTASGGAARGGGGSVRGSTISSGATPAAGPMGLGALFANGAPKLKPVGGSRDSLSLPSALHPKSQPPALAPRLNNQTNGISSTPTAAAPPPLAARPRGPSVGAKPGLPTGSPTGGNTPKFSRSPAKTGGLGTSVANKPNPNLASRPPPPRPGGLGPIPLNKPPPPAGTPPSIPSAISSARSTSRDFGKSNEPEFNSGGGLVSARANVFGGASSGSAGSRRSGGNGGMIPSDSRHSINAAQERWTFRKDYPPPRPFPGSGAPSTSSTDSFGRPSRPTSTLSASGSTTSRPPAPSRAPPPPAPARRPPRPMSSSPENVQQYVTETAPKLDAELENCISRQDFMRCAAVKSVKERLLKLGSGPVNIEEFNKVKEDISRNGYVS